VSAHWESAPVTLGSTRTVDLTYDFYGFPRRYYEIRYEAPGAPDLAASVRTLMPDSEPVADDPKGLLSHARMIEDRSRISFKSHGLLMIR
jgi:4,5-DOPA dioxygenase extradiol